MRVDRLLLEDFRNYASGEVVFGPGINLVTGRNAQGKTNLLEAVYLLTGLGSPRGPDASVVRRGAARALLHGDVVRGSRRLKIDFEMQPGRGTRALLNGTPLPRSRSLAEVAVAVFFGPDELSLVKGGPDGRRRFLDDLVVKLRPASLSIRREWERVLRQRNALLKSAPRGPAGRVALQTLDVWDDALARAGASVTAARLRALAAMRPFARARYQEISGTGALKLEYTSAWLTLDMLEDAMREPASLEERALADALRERVGEERAKEIERGVSLVGPHRDDIAVGIGSAEQLMDARTFASQGDQRTAALALKLAEFDLIVDATGEDPILLLDDVFSELDPERREWLADSVRSAGQVILTSAEPGAAGAARAERAVRVEEGKVFIDE